MMKNPFSILLIWIWAIVILLPSRANADRTLFSVSTKANGGANLRVIDSLTGATVTTIPITLSGFTVEGATGLARDPTTGKLWALLRVAGATPCGLTGNISQLAT